MPATATSNDTPKQEAVKAIDLELALSIAAGGGIRTHDKLGRVNDEVWSQFRDSSTLGKLVEAKDIRKLLLDQIQLQLEAKKDLLLEVENDTVICGWIIRYTQAWEQEYSKSVNMTFDIGRKITAIMHDTLFEVREILNVDASALKIEAIEEAVRRAHSEHDDTGHKLLQGDDAVVRFLFRNPYTRYHMVRIASRLLLKKEVCNRAGAYSAKQQRHDVTQEKDTALTGLYYDICEQDPRFALCRDLLESDDFVDYITDYMSLA